MDSILSYFIRKHIEPCVMHIATDVGTCLEVTKSLFVDFSCIDFFLQVLRITCWIFQTTKFDWRPHSWADTCQMSKWYLISGQGFNTRIPNTITSPPPPHHHHPQPPSHHHHPTPHPPTPIPPPPPHPPSPPPPHHHHHHHHHHPPPPPTHPPPTTHPQPPPTPPPPPPIHPTSTHTDHTHIHQLSFSHRISPNIYVALYETTFAWQQIKYSWGS